MNLLGAERKQGSEAIGLVSRRGTRSSGRYGIDQLFDKKQTSPKALFHGPLSPSTSADHHRTARTQSSGRVAGAQLNSNRTMGGTSWSSNLKRLKSLLTGS